MKFLTILVIFALTIAIIIPFINGNESQEEPEKLENSNKEENSVEKCKEDSDKVEKPEKPENLNEEENPVKKCEGGSKTVEKPENSNEEIEKCEEGSDVEIERVKRVKVEKVEVEEVEVEEDNDSDCDKSECKCDSGEGHHHHGSCEDKNNKTLDDLKEEIAEVVVEIAETVVEKAIEAVEEVVKPENVKLVGSAASMVGEGLKGLRRPF